MQANEHLAPLRNSSPQQSVDVAATKSSSINSQPQGVLSVVSSEEGGPIALATVLQRLLGPCITFIALVVSAEFYGVAFVGSYMALGLISALLVFMLFRQAAINQFWRRDAVAGLVTHILGTWLMVLGILLLFGAVAGTFEQYANRTVYAWALLTPLLLVAQQLLTRTFLLRRTRTAENIRRAVIVGFNPVSLRLIREFESSPNLGIRCLGIFDDRSAARLPDMAPEYSLGWLDDLVGYVKRERVQVIYITLPMTQHARIMTLLDSLRDTTASIYFVPNPFMFDVIQGRIAGINGLPAVAVCESPFTGVDGVVKRAIDVSFAVVALLLISPLLGLIALGVKLDSPGPALFKQRRYGIDGQEIMVFKFRTMAVCEDGAHIVQARRDDPRVTSFGAFLRRSSLDELPQLINVLRGEMSLVGPRPHAVAHNEQYRGLINGYMLRHKVRPGITGWAQVNGLRGETDSLDKMRNRVEYDLDYLRHWSLLLDFKIICMTIWVLFRDRHAY